MTQREVKIRRAVLRAAKAMPAGILLPDDLLREEAARLVVPRPLVSEMEEQIREAEKLNQLIGVQTDEGTKWQIGDTGHAWLATHP